MIKKPIAREPSKSRLIPEKKKEPLYRKGIRSLKVVGRVWNAALEGLKVKGE